MQQTILAILEKLHPEHDFTDSDDFITDGLLDSLDIPLLVRELETGFDISIDGDQIIQENFLNCRCIEALVKKYRK